jgi:hypothetical protein
VNACISSSSDELEVQEVVDTPGGSAATVKRSTKPDSITKAPAKSPKPAGLSKPGKSDTTKPTGASKTTKPDSTKQASLSKPGSAAEKVGKYRCTVMIGRAFTLHVNV